jgi:hypothetical protein
MFLPQGFFFIIYRDRVGIINQMTDFLDITLYILAKGSIQELSPQPVREGEL